MANEVNYPLRFEPIFKERIWGGRRLETALGKELPAGKLIGESWEISNHGDDSSVIANGPLRGRTLRELMQTAPESLLGDNASPRDAQVSNSSLQFPLLVKWIDAREKLSIQVHPPDDHPRLPPGERGKTECWFVVGAEPGSEIYLGLRRGIDRAALLHELSRGTVDRCLSVLPARPGDFFFVPAGTPHAIGAGVLLAEIQQTSDTTFRLFDWNRIDPATGRPRKLQIEEALDSINFHADTSVFDSTAAHTAATFRITLLSPDQCPYFALSWRRFVAVENFAEPERCHVLVCLCGSGAIVGGAERILVKRGDSLLLPSGGKFTCEPLPTLELLDAWVL